MQAYELLLGALFTPRNPLSAEDSAAVLSLLSTAAAAKDSRSAATFPLSQTFFVIPY